MSVALVWLRRDLRLADQPALHAALAAADSVVPVYVHAPEEDGAWAPGAASRWWLHRSLVALDRSLRSRGGALVIRRGPSVPALKRLARDTGAATVHYCRRYEPAGEAHDRQVAAALEQSGLRVLASDGASLFRPGSVLTGGGGPYRVFTPFWRRCEALLDGLPPPAPAPRRVPAPAGKVAGLEPEELELQPRTAWDAGLRDTWVPGEAGAHQALERFTQHRLDRYDEHRDRPDLAGTSRLSPHLHFGELSPRQVLAAVRHREDAARPFLRQLGWREFACHLLHHFPHTADAPLDARFARLSWRDDPAALAAWQRGRTGYPIVDAGLRELWHTGWMHNRVRMIAASLLAKNLRLHWLHGARWFWDTLVDADLANNTLGWQWVAGCGADAAPYFRIFNPVLQGQRFDPGGAYVRRWLPELAPLPDRWVHRPWQAPERVLRQAGLGLGRDYPLPIVDLNRSRAEALDAFARLGR